MKVIQFLIVIVLLAGAIIFMTLNGKPHAYLLLSLVCAFACGWYAKKTNFGRVK